MNILIIEDDTKIARFVEQGLRGEGFETDTASDGEQGLTLAHVNRYDAIVLDLMLPKKNGIQVASELRQEGRTTPILMVTARDATEDIVRGLDAGADDYLTKPFRFDELLARLRALVRRGGAARLDRLTAGPIVVDRIKHQAFASGRRLDLTPREFQLLEHFLLHAGQVVRRTELLEKVWDMRFDPESNVVDVHVGNLRRKLREAGADGLLQTVRAVGFMLQEPAAELV